MFVLPSMDVWISFSIQILVKIIGSHEGREFDNRQITFVLGETGDDEKDGGCIVGIQEALIYFGKGEVSRWVFGLLKSLLSDHRLTCWNIILQDWSFDHGMHGDEEEIKHLEFHRWQPLSIWWRWLISKRIKMHGNSDHAIALTRRWEWKIKPPNS